VPQQGEEAVATVLQLVDDPDAGPRRVILPTELVVRRSTVGRR
jgi:DNA-binding LacI/PurR family transcriptional regulator